MLSYDPPSEHRKTTLRSKIDALATQQQKLAKAITELALKKEELSQQTKAILLEWKDLTGNVYHQIITTAVFMAEDRTDLVIPGIAAARTYHSDDKEENADPFRDQKNPELQGIVRFFASYNDEKNEYSIRAILDGKDKLDEKQPRYEKLITTLKNDTALVKGQELAAIAEEKSLSQIEREQKTELNRSDRKLKIVNWAADTLYWMGRNKRFGGSLALLTIALTILFPPSLAVTLPLLALLATCIQTYPSLRNWIEKQGGKLALLIIVFTAMIFLPLIPIVGLSLHSIIPISLAKIALISSNITLGSTLLMLSPLLTFIALPVVAGAALGVSLNFLGRSSVIIHRNQQLS
ncbi:hypothetical protein BH10PSE19_BH10PSE19_19330 [soil metagenome]